MKIAIIILGLFSLLSEVMADPFFPKQWSLLNDGTQTVTLEPDDLHTIQQKGIAGVDIGWLPAKEKIAVLAQAPVLVAVIDSGIDPTHPDIQGRISSEGFDFLNNSQRLSDDLGHGTHVAGIIAANWDNGIGISGVAPSSVTVLPLRILSNGFKNFSYKGKLISDYAADAIRYAVAHHVSIINMSLGWPKLVDSENSRSAVREAIANGVLIVASAGNDRKALPTYPCAYEGVLCVGAVTNTGAMSIYSNSGGLTDLLAPGDGIISLYPLSVESQFLRLQGYEMLTGTSQAAPIISGVAAVVRSVFPGISLAELKARILVSTRPVPTEGSALYGLPNIGSAIDVAPEPVFLPDFKALPEEAIIDEATFRVNGEVAIENLWQEANDVNVEVFVNGKLAGHGTASSVIQGGRISVPWSAVFNSLNDISQVELVANMNYKAATVGNIGGSSYAKRFQFIQPVVRRAEMLSSKPAIEVPAATRDLPEDWIGVTNGHRYSKLRQMLACPSHDGIPNYYQQLPPVEGASSGVSLEIFNPTTNVKLTKVDVPNVDRVVQVIQIDLLGDGSKEFVITGVGKVTQKDLSADQAKLFFQFYFLDSKYAPLWGGQSTWQIPLDATFGKLILRDYSAPGSWLRGDKNQLLPSFLGNGVLPDIDGFGALDPRHAWIQNHIYYLEPAATAESGIVPLSLRAMDNAKMRESIDDLHVQTLVPSAAAEQKLGHLRALVNIGDVLDTAASVWDIRSVSDNSLSSVSGWDSLSSRGKLTIPAGSDSSAFINFFDSKRGSVAWSLSDGSFSGRSEFSFDSIENPITGIVGAVDLARVGRFLFLESAFDLVIFGNQQAGSVEKVTLPIERDSSFPGEEFNELFSPVVVGEPGNPLPGVYVDSTLVRGDRVSVAVFNPAVGQFYRPLRYSLSIPDNCVQMTPIVLSDDITAFALPLLCRDGEQRYMLQIIRP